VAARLVIGADGRASPTREAAGIAVSTWRYGQKALAFAVGHDEPHDNISTEIYLSGGAFTLVPLPDHQGRPASAVVWMDDGPETLRRAKLDSEDLGREATLRSTGILGELRPVTRVAVFPVVTQLAKALVAERTVLIAEAAHVMPPIGAQGLNTSLHDVAALAALAEAQPAGLGQASFLDAYARARGRDLAARARVIDAFNRLCRSGAPAFQDLRGKGLGLVHDFKPLRRRVMRAGLGG
jgi:2-octaprenyl-6-methoxyphenol hydroxylase